MRCCRSKNTLLLAAVAIVIYVVYHTDLLTSKPNHDEREREADRMDQKPDFESDDLMDGRRHRQDVDMRRRDRDPVNDDGGEAKMLRRNRIHDAGDVHMERDNGDDEDDGDRDASRHRIRAERLRATRAPLRHLKREESDRDVRRHNPQPDAPMGEPDEEDPHRRHPKYVEAAEILETPDDEELTKILMEMAAGKESSAFGGKLRKSVPYNKFSTNCTVNIAANVKVYTPFKIYILTLPARYNTDILKCVDKVFYDGCFKTDHCGFGPEMYSELSGDISARDSWQFSLDVIMHHKLLLSPYRTFNIHEADAIYVPYYAAGDCFCSQQKSDYPTVNENAIGLMQLIREHRPFVAKKPYVMTLGKIEREHMTLSCPWLLQKLVSYEMFYIGIEQESNARFRIANRKNVFPLILAPYPSYGHLATNGGKKYISALHASPRPVFILLAAATRRSNPFRAKILDQFKDHKTNDRYELYTRAKGITGSIELMHYVTPECRGDHSKYTMDWMKRATICLQPPGDSETRKSIYDSIISGCIPAFFEPEHPVKLPFSRTLDYESFSITIPRSVVSEDLSIIQFLKERYEPKYIKALQKNLKQVAKYFQYSFPVTNDEHTDAVKLILDDLQHTLEHN